MLQPSARLPTRCTRSRRRLFSRRVVLRLRDRQLHLLDTGRHVALQPSPPDSSCSSLVSRLDDSGRRRRRESVSSPFDSHPAFFAALQFLGG
jgi:hypothetical protein